MSSVDKFKGLNVGIDDAVRAANAISRSIDRSNYDPEYMGQFYLVRLKRALIRGIWKR